MERASDSCCIPETNIMFYVNYTPNEKIKRVKKRGAGEEEKRKRERKSRAAPDRDKDTDWKLRQRADTKGQRAEPKCGSLISCRKSWQKSSEKNGKGENLPPVKEKEGTGGKQLNTNNRWR